MSFFEFFNKKITFKIIFINIYKIGMLKILKLEVLHSFFNKQF